MTIVNYDDDSAPGEGAYIHKTTLEPVDSIELAFELLPAIAELHRRIKAGGPGSPTCFCCEKPLRGLPAFAARHTTVLVANSRADPRRYRQALASTPQPTQALIGLCTACGSDGRQVSYNRLKARIESDMVASGMTAGSEHAARFMRQEGKA